MGRELNLLLDFLKTFFFGQFDKTQIKNNVWRLVKRASQAIFYGAWAFAFGAFNFPFTMHKDNICSFDLRSRDKSDVMIC